LPELEQYFITSAIPSYTVLFTYNGQVATDFFKQDISAQKNQSLETSTCTRVLSVIRDQYMYSQDSIQRHCCIEKICQHIEFSIILNCIIHHVMTYLFTFVCTICICIYNTNVLCVFIKNMTYDTHNRTT